MATTTGVPPPGGIYVEGENGVGYVVYQVPKGETQVAVAGTQGPAPTRNDYLYVDGAKNDWVSVIAGIFLTGVLAMGVFLVVVYAFEEEDEFNFDFERRLELDLESFVQVVFNSPETDITINNAFVLAAIRWSLIFNGTNLIPETNTLSTFNDVCTIDDSTVAFPNVSTIDKVYIAAIVTSQDGIGGTVATAGPCGLFMEVQENGFFVPAVGVITFDLDDLRRLAETRQLQDVILHEMAHVFGFGTLWGDIRTTSALGGAPVVEDVIYPSAGVAQPENEPIYTGAEGKNGRVDVGGGTLADIEVEDGSFEGLSSAQILAGAGRGSVDSHWMESIYGDELMTPAISGSERPLSVMTLRSFRDLGYTVDTAWADAYSFTPPGAIVASSTAQQKPAEEDHDGVYTLLLNDTFHDPAIPYVLAKLEASRERVANGRRGLGGPTYATIAMEAVQEYRAMKAQAAP